MRNQCGVRQVHASVVSLILTVALASTWPYPLSAQGAASDTAMSNKITIRVGNNAYDATLADNATTTAFKKLLPLTVAMTELNGNEKFARLSAAVPARASTPPSIQTGDLMLYGSNTLVLFYKTFHTTYSYTNIGRVDDPSGLEAALGSGNVDVTFEAKGERKTHAEKARSGGKEWRNEH
jgi:hypothetical protein